MIAELKSDPNKRAKSEMEVARSHEVISLFKTTLISINLKSYYFFKMEETLSRIEEFHAKITSLEDELNEARTETSRIKTEYINEKSAKEIKISELQTKINEVSPKVYVSIVAKREFVYYTRVDVVCAAGGRQDHGHGTK